MNLPARREILLRAQWLAQLSVEQRSSLETLPIGTVDALYDRWRDEQDALPVPDEP